MKSLALIPLLAAAIWLAVPAVAMAAPRGVDDDVPREADARTQYSRASLAKKQIRGLKGETRSAAQRQAAVAFEAVARYFPEEAPLAGRALYQAAEIYETLRDREKGLACVKQVLAMHAEAITKARAHILLGHMYRRAGNPKAAAKEYETVNTDFTKLKTQVAEALGWLGKCKARLGDHQGAREAWRARMERFTDRYALVIESSDWIAVSLFKEGKSREARETLDACREKMKDAAADSGPAGQRVRKALARMRIVRLLNRAAPAGNKGNDGKNENP
jgi:tetratricopeptide (TPR) repeat protein